MLRKKVLLTGVLIAAMLAGSAGALQAQTLFGARLGAYTDQEDLFIGGELLTPMGDSFFLNPNVEYVFADRANQLTFNFDAHYDFARRASMTFWVGAGLGILYFDPEGRADSNTDVGANLLFGAAFLEGSDLVPYLQVKFIAAENSELAVGFGVRF